MSLQFIKDLEPVDNRLDNRRWLIRKPDRFEVLVLNQIAEVVLIYTGMAIAWHTHNDVAEPDIVLWTRRPAANADHEADPDTARMPTVIHVHAWCVVQVCVT